MFESMTSCDAYIEGKAEITVYLPKLHPTCQYCMFISYHENYDRYQCRLTGEYIFNYKKERGEQCKFDWKEKKGV